MGNNNDETTPLNGGGSAALAGNIARAAFEGADAERSRKYHEMKLSTHNNNNNNNGRSASEEGHQSEGGMVKPIIFGGLDGILTSFAIVAGAAGGRLSPSVVLILGVSNIFADALSMGVGEFLSSKANNDWILSERRREEWELENYPEGEIQEMIDIYVRKGMTLEHAQQCIGIMAQYKDLFVDVMMTQELELQVPEENHVQESIKEGIVMFLAFSFFGALPLLGYIIIPGLFPDLTTDALFASACIVTGCVLFLMGIAKSKFTTQHWLHAGVETLLLGGVCATVAYTIGQLVEHYTGEVE